MTDYAATVLQNYISMYQGRLDKNEQRPSIYGGLDLFKAQSADPTGILDTTVKANIEKSFNTTVQVPVVNYKDITIGNVRSCAMQANGLTSALVTLTAVTYVWGFVAFPMQHYENYVGYQETINKLMDSGLTKLAATIDAACINALETDKNQYFPQALLDYYAETGDALRVPQADKNDFYNNLGSIMQTMDFPGMQEVTTNPIGMSMVRRLANQGAGNATNEAFQFNGYKWYPTNGIANGANVESTLYAVAPGQVALHSRIDPSSSKREKIHENKYWDQIPNAPYINMPLGLFYQADCSDASALQAAGLTNSTRVKVESWEFSLDVFYITPYNSAPATRYNPILKAEILA